MIHFISSRDLIGSSILTTLALHHCFGPSAPSLCSSFPTMRFVTSKSPTCPSRLQPVHQAKSCLDLLHLDHMTQCHVLCAMSYFIITCVSFAIFPSHFHLHGICCSHTYICGLITCVSHINTISPPRLSLNYQNQQGPFTIVHQRQVLLKLHRHAVHHSKAFDLPFTLATGPSSQVLS